jgi:hypothetical protein
MVSLYLTWTAYPKLFSQKKFQFYIVELMQGPALRFILLRLDKRAPYYFSTTDL